MESNMENSTFISAPSEEFVTNLLLKPSFTAKHVPTVYAMAGIPAAGKSTFVEMMQSKGEFPKEAFILNPDLVLNSLPEYIEDCKNSGAEKAFNTWDIPCRDLAYNLFEKAANHKLDIIKDMGNARLENIEKLQHLKKSGYCIKVFFIYLNTDIAIKRMQERERHTPVEMIVERAASLKTLVTDLQNVADVFQAYDNSGVKCDYKEISVEELSNKLNENY